MSFSVRKSGWSPSKTERLIIPSHGLGVYAYAARCRQIESDPGPGAGWINCTGDCCEGDIVAYYNANVSSDLLYGRIVHESYGEAKQQHTFTLSLLPEGPYGPEQGTARIKGRNLYRHGTWRQEWEDEARRKVAIEGKHQRGEAARKAAEKKEIEKI